MEEYFVTQTLLRAASKTTIDLNNVFGATMGAGAGIYWFFKGFKDLQNKRTIENIPTSPIATGAVGSDVEIKGRIICDEDKTLNAPISNKRCAFYILNISKLVASGNSDKWEPVDNIYSDDGFFVEDNSGANALVLTEGAKIIQKKDRHGGYQINKTNWQRIPASIKNALDQHQHQLKNFKILESNFSKGQVYSLSETRFDPGEEMYILGYAESGLKLPTQHKNKSADFQKLASRTKMIFKDKPPHTFLISDQKEEDLVQGLIWMTRIKVFGGPALTIACSLYLISIYDDLMRFF